MDNLRTYGKAPFNIAVIHGGPGAPGEMAPVARELSKNFGILEPLQTADSIDDQISELKSVLEKSGDPPVTLVGFSWGAWLSCIFAARNPSMVKKLILVSSGPFEDKYAALIMSSRLNHLNDGEKEEVLSLSSAFNSGGMNNDNFTRFGVLMDKADSFDSLPHSSDVLPCNPDIYQKVWVEASQLRSGG